MTIKIKLLRNEWLFTFSIHWKIPASNIEQLNGPPESPRQVSKFPIPAQLFSGLCISKLIENNRFSIRSDWKKISHRLYIKPFLENPVKLSHFSFSTKGIETFCKILARIFWWAENPKLYIIDLEIKYWYKPTIPQPTAEQQDPTGKVENFEIPGKQIGAIARLNSSFSFNRITAIS